MAPCRDTGIDTAPDGESWAPYFANFEHVQPVVPEDPDDKVFIGHMDTGFQHHPDIVMSQIRNDLGRNFVEPDLMTALTPLDQLPPLDPSMTDRVAHALNGYESHGTASLSVAIGQRTIPGATPQLFYAPQRCVQSPILHPANLADLAEAIAHFAFKAPAGPHVVAMSLGTAPDHKVDVSVSRIRKVREEIDFLSTLGIILIAAAGQIPFVRGNASLEKQTNKLPLSFPAEHPSVIAVGAHDKVGAPYTAGLYNSADLFDEYVDLLAPGVDVQIARIYSTDGNTSPFGRLETSSGTTYAAQLTAAAAGLWILKWGKRNLVQRYGLHGIAAAFTKCLLESCDPRTRPDESDPDHNNYGAGLLNVDCLLEHPLPAP